MPSYETLYLEASEAIAHAWYELRARAFAESYDDTQPTILLLPGGMASQIYVYPKVLDGAALPLPGVVDLSGSSLVWIDLLSALPFFIQRYADLYINDDGIEDTHRPCFAGNALDTIVASPYPPVRNAVEE